MGGLVYHYRNRIIERLPATSTLIPTGLTRRDVRIGLRASATAHGFPPEWFDAIGKHESNWKLDARSPPSQADEKYGGAWGPMQMLRTNIERLNYTVAEVISDISSAAECAALLMMEGNPQTFEDAVAWWNAGKKHQSDVSAGSTEQSYLADITANDLPWVLENPPT